MAYCLVLPVAVSSASAHPPAGSGGGSSSTGTFRYPRVYGPTGTPYGPTQAHYQYLRRYGRPWHGMGGLSVPNGGPAGHVHIHVPPYGVFYGCAPAIVVAPPSYIILPPDAWMAPAPGVFVSGGVLGPSPYDNPVIAATIRENQARWDGPIQVEPAAPIKKRKPAKSSPEAQLRSMRLQSHGDARLKQQDYTRAYLRYRDAISAAEDRADPWFRRGLVLVALGRFERAVRDLKRGLELDPEWPEHGESLETLFGEDNRLAVNSMLLKAAAWVREDVRDPDRLFLMGVLLHFDDRPDKARPFFEAALRLAGEGAHLLAFFQAGPKDVAEAGTPTEADLPGTPDGRGGKEPPKPTMPPDDSFVPPLPAAPLAPPAPLSPGQVLPQP